MKALNSHLFLRCDDKDLKIQIILEHLKNKNINVMSKQGEFIKKFFSIDQNLNNIIGLVTDSNFDYWYVLRDQVKRKNVYCNSYVDIDKENLFEPYLLCDIRSGMGNNIVLRGKKMLDLDPDYLLKVRDKNIDDLLN